jgi:hypothetical protein
MARKTPAPEIVLQRTSLFPFFPSLLQHRHAGAAIALLYFIVLTVLSIQYHQIGDYGVETDFYWSHVPEAQRMLEGNLQIQDFQGPLYPAVLAGASLVTADLFRAGTLLATLSAAVALLLIYQLFRILLRYDMALVGTLLVAVNTVFVQYSYSAGTDMLFNVLVLGAVVLVLSQNERRWSSVALSGLLAGCAYLTRYNGVVLLLAIPLAFLLANPYRLAMNERLKTAGVFAGCFLIVIAPWGVYSLIEKGSFFYNKNYLNIAYEMYAKGRMSWDEFWYQGPEKYSSLAQVFFTDPVLFLKTVVGNSFTHALSDLENLAGWQVGVFSVAGTVLLVRGKPSSHILAFLIISFLFFGVLLLVFYSERFSLFLLTAYVLLALKALTWPKLAEYRFWNRVHLGALLALVIMIWTTARSYDFNARNISSGPIEVLSIAEWFHSAKGTAPDGTLILARKPHIAYYLGMELVSFHVVSTFEELFSEIKQKNVSYVYFGLMEAGLRPQFRSLLDPRQPPSFLRPLTYTISPPAVLYQVVFPELQ